MFQVAALRYGIMLVGGIYLYLFVGPLRIHPTVFGGLTGRGDGHAEYATLHTLLHAVGTASWPWCSGRSPRPRSACCWATVFQVLALGWYNLKVMSGKARAQQGRVVGDVRWGAQ